jgi:hypothetical protein
MKSLLCGFILGSLLGCSSGFSDQEISQVRTSIKDHFEQKGFTVTEISLVKESNETLSGFVRLSKTVPQVGDMDFSKVCTARMDQHSSRFTWDCDDR